MRLTRIPARAAVLGLLPFVFLCACSDGSSNHPGGPDIAYYIDCDAATSGDGSQGAPWNDLDAASSITLEPGAHLLLRRGSRCTGMLKPTGSGTAQQRIVIGAYGEGALPLIDAAGANTAAVHLEDMSHIVVRDLELTNPGDLEEPHRGVYLTALAGPVTGVEIRDLYIHDVTGPVGFNGTAKSGGAIISRSLGGPEAKFDSVLIENNRIEDVGRSGIFFIGSSAKTRPLAAQPWPDGGTNIVIRGNTLQRLQGDAIVAHSTSGAVIEDNVVTVGNLAGRDYRSEERNCAAGIWAWNANNTLIQRNEVSGYRFGQSPDDGCDGTGFDIDNRQAGTVIQYNYSHNNEGGFILLCSDDEPHDALVRYNLSIDDGKVLNVSPCKFPTIGTFDDIRIYNNTFVMPHPHTALELSKLSRIHNAGDLLFANNIVYATTPQSDALACGDRCSNNLFYNLPPSGTEQVVGDPLFEDVMWRGAGRLEAGTAFRIPTSSPAFAAGQGVVDAPATDYFGDEVPLTPSIGMHQPQ
ncbi:MAG: right-handed parallel beta-helix repeat-containing protein [Halioglobus sp.]|nr:right-handed parallel beta-helix repeat-containing protein [Halioglobus sp.]